MDYSGRHRTVLAFAESYPTHSDPDASPIRFSNYLAPGQLEVTPRGPSRFQRIRGAAGTICMAAVATIPVLDLAGSDALFAKIYQATGQMTNLEQNAIVGGSIVLESTILNTVVSRSSPLKVRFNQLDAYLEARRATMGKPRRILSKVVNSPAKALEKIVTPLQTGGEKFEKSDSKVVRTAGRVLVDVAMVNTIGTAGVALVETADNRRPTFIRNLGLGAKFASTWQPIAAGFQALSDNVRVLHDYALHPAYEAYHLMTNVDIMDPATTPFGVLSMGVLATMAVGTGYNAIKAGQHAAESVSQNSNGPVETQPDPAALSLANGFSQPF